MVKKLSHFFFFLVLRFDFSRRGFKLFLWWLLMHNKGFRFRLDDPHIDFAEFDCILKPSLELSNLDRIWQCSYRGLRHCVNSNKKAMNFGNWFGIVITSHSFQSRFWSKSMIVSDNLKLILLSCNVWYQINSRKTGSIQLQKFFNCDRWSFLKAC